MKVVIVGGVAAGPKAAAKIIRMKPDTDVTIIEKGCSSHTPDAVFPTMYPGKSKNRKS